MAYKIEDLTEKDKEWLQRLADGVQVKALSDRRWTDFGVRNRLIKIRKTLGAESNIQAVAVAMRAGLVK